MGGLFRTGVFQLHSGFFTDFKIDCDALSDADLDALAYIVSPTVMPFSSVVPIPTGGIRFAEALEEYATIGDRLIVDDVLTTGASMQAEYQNGDKGVVIFSRSYNIPEWITAIWQLTL